MQSCEHKKVVVEMSRSGVSEVYWTVWQLQGGRTYEITASQSVAEGNRVLGVEIVVHQTWQLVHHSPLSCHLHQLKRASLDRAEILSVCLQLRCCCPNSSLHKRWLMPPQCHTWTPGMQSKRSSVSWTSGLLWPFV